MRHEPANWLDATASNERALGEVESMCGVNKGFTLYREREAQAHTVCTRSLRRLHLAVELSIGGLLCSLGTWLRQRVALQPWNAHPRLLPESQHPCDGPRLREGG